MSYLGVDFGLCHIGLAVGLVSSEKKYSVDPISPLKNIDREITFKELSQVCLDYRIDTIVFGLPYLKDGREGKLGLKIREFSQKFVDQYNKKYPLQPVNSEFVDESLTSFEAQRTPSPLNLGRKKRKENSHSLAAALILENYLGTTLRL